MLLVSIAYTSESQEDWCRLPLTTSFTQHPMCPNNIVKSMQIHFIRGTCTCTVPNLQDSEYRETLPQKIHFPVSLNRQDAWVLTPLSSGVCLYASLQQNIHDTGSVLFFSQIHKVNSDDVCWFCGMYNGGLL